MSANRTPGIMSLYEPECTHVLFDNGSPLLSPKFAMIDSDRRSSHVDDTSIKFAPQLFSRPHPCVVVINTNNIVFSPAGFQRSKLWIQPFLHNQSTGFKMRYRFDGEVQCCNDLLLRKPYSWRNDQTGLWERTDAEDHDLAFELRLYPLQVTLLLELEAVHHVGSFQEYCAELCVIRTSR